MPVEFTPVAAPSTWRNFRRHPASADYGDLSKGLAKKMKKGVEKYGVIERSIILYRDEHGEPLVLDGWQLLRACIAANVAPKFVELLGGIPVEDFVQIVNDFRRHEDAGDMQRRLAVRRKRSQEGFQNGVPVAEMAAEAGVSPSTIYNDINAKPEPFAGTIRCERCVRMNLAGDDCARCAVMRLPAPPNPEPPPPPEPEPPQDTYDANFVTIPEHVLGAFLTAGEIAHLCHELDQVAKTLAKILADKVGARAISATAAQRLVDVRKHLWQARATHVCAYCAGRPMSVPCTACRGEGWQPGAAFAQAPKEFQDNMKRLGAQNVPI